MRLKYKSGKMRLRTPDIEDEEMVFHPVARLGAWEPFGYKEDPDDSDLLQPVVEELILLEKAKIYLKRGFSLRDVANWLSEESGRKISHQGLKARVETDQNRDKDALNSRYVAKQLVEVWKKAKRIEARRLGKRDPNEKELELEIFNIAREACKD